jgi:hypothetical protein
VALLFLNEFRGLIPALLKRVADRDRGGAGHAWFRKLKVGRVSLGSGRR